jgi:hypothetical protein
MQASPPHQRNRLGNLAVALATLKPDGLDDLQGAFYAWSQAMESYGGTTRDEGR